MAKKEFPAGGGSVLRHGESWRDKSSLWQYFFDRFVLCGDRFHQFTKHSDFCSARGGVEPLEAISGESNLRELRRILHVEDEPDIQELVRIALGVVGGFEVEQADSGQAAIAAVKRRMPDMVLLDQMMPNMSGDETLQELRKIPGFEKVVCVFLSAKVSSSEPETRSDGVTTLRKPFDIAKLKVQLLAIWRENTEEA